MKKLSKKFSQYIHARRRAIERFGMRYNRYVRKELVKMILSGDATFIERQSCRVSKWRIVYERQEFAVAYDNRRKTIITFLYIDEGEKDD